MDYQYIVYFALIIVVIGIVYQYFRQREHYSQELSRIKDSLTEAQDSIKSENERLKAALQISHKFVEADNEGDIVDYLLKIAMDMTGAMGVSFVPLDNHGLPLAASRMGEFPFPVPDAWLEYLASPNVRTDCATCKRRGSIVKTCPLLKGPFSEALGLYCLPLRKGEREYGVLNIYMPDVSVFDQSARDFLQSLVDATALAVEGVRLRRSEHDTLSQLRAVQQQADIKLILYELLENARVTLQAEYGLLLPQRKFLHDLQFMDPEDEFVMVCGEISVSLRQNLEDLAHEAIKTSKEFKRVLPAASGEQNSVEVNVLGMPILINENIPLGVVLIAQEGDGSFDHEHVRSLKSIASQIGLVLQTSNNIAEISYKTMMDERIRLAREIHDGLAQTLGFLKLLVAQMQDHIERRDFERLSNTVQTCYQTLSDAYLDAREAIDGLRVYPSGERGYASVNLTQWLQQTISEFQENQEVHTFSVALENKGCSLNLPPEIQAQLIRIVQEALSNVRKHAQATHADIRFHENDGDLIMEICDDGCGFSPEEVPDSSRHGLKGMRERSELIGADFQVISLPGEGTAVRLRLPSSAVNKWKRVYEAYKDSGS